MAGFITRCLCCGRAYQTQLSGRCPDFGITPHDPETLENIFIYLVFRCGYDPSGGKPLDKETHKEAIKAVIFDKWKPAPDMAKRLVVPDNVNEFYKILESR